MKHITGILLAVFFLLACVDREKTETMVTQVNIIPRPVSVKTGPGKFYLSEKTEIIVGSGEQNSAAVFLKDFLNLQGVPASINSKNKPDKSFIFKKIDEQELGKEGYRLKINKKEVTIEANGDAGFFYGVQSLFQLFRDSSHYLPLVEITDYPRFSYRGLHLDVCRHMFPVSFIKKYIDLMSHYKFNTFHWHLTEDQGWRIEIKKYHKLQEIAAFRKETLIGHASASPEKFDGVPYGGFYSQEEIKEIIDYATRRNVNIIPEIELPGHSLAALTAYPHLGCTGGPYETATTWGVFDDVYCAGKETTFEFLEGVLDEVIELFPGKYIHIGGDECPKIRWKNCPFCQQRLQNEKIKDEHELQSYFIHRIEKYINSKGKSIIGWDEILEGGIAPNATIMSWRGEEGGILAAKQKHDVIMTPMDWCYLDHYQANPEAEPLAIGGMTTVHEIYDYEPVPNALSQEEAKYIIGAQCNLWTEYILTPEHVEYMIYPRAIAMSEVLWSEKKAGKYEDFVSRMNHHRSLMTKWNINYANHMFSFSDSLSQK